ncbi:MAG: FAD-binding domain [Gulosibacter sp.]|uniref:FAD-binding domain n=1 Tax=Gulosibacter sp. TaxID=2817531 RepID=UPI003F8F7C49
MRILIVGTGIAGPTLAYWLVRAGHECTIIERAPQLRQGGYLIDFWGAGFDVAERMGIVPRLMEVGYQVRELRELDARGRATARMDPGKAIAGTNGRFVSLARADLAKAIFDASANHVETVFGDTVTSLSEDGERVRVEFECGPEREFDLVVGADGLHSRVRKLTFGENPAFLRPMGIAVASFDIEGYEPRTPLVGVTHTEVGAQLLRFTLRDGATMFALTFAHDSDLPTNDPARGIEFLRERLGWMRGETPAVLARLPEARTFYLDHASQVRLPSWSRGRIALVGDAGACPSLLAGQGSALAMTEAYILAHALSQGAEVSTALERYEQQLFKFVRAKQNAATRMGIAFAPRNRAQLWARNTAIRIAGLPLVADLAVRRGLVDRIALPDWPHPVD